MIILNVYLTKISEFDSHEYMKRYKNSVEKFVSEVCVLHDKKIEIRTVVLAADCSTVDCDVSLEIETVKGVEGLKKRFNENLKLLTDCHPKKNHRKPGDRFDFHKFKLRLMFINKGLIIQRDIYNPERQGTVEGITEVIN